MNNEAKLEMTAHITAKPGKGRELKAALKEVVELTKKEPGCLEFRIFEDLENPEKFVLWEVFRDRQALVEHIETDYTRKYFANGLIQSTQVTKMRSF